MGATTGDGRSRRAWLALAALPTAAVVLLGACSSSGSKNLTSGSTGGAASATSSPGTMLSTANVAGLGMVVVDGRGHTVYVLTSGGRTNVPCDDANGCTKVWPDLPLPAGTPAATAGAGLQASLLGTMKLSDGETYPTYGGWLMYEFSQDTAAAQGHGEGITSFGGTWYAISPSGDPVMPPSTTTTTVGSTPTTVRSPVTAPVTAAPRAPTTAPPATPAPKPPVTSPPATSPPTTASPPPTTPVTQPCAYPPCY